MFFFLNVVFLVFAPGVPGTSFFLPDLPSPTILSKRVLEVFIFFDVVFLERVVSDATLSNAILPTLFGMAAKILPGALEVKSNGI